MNASKTSVENNPEQVSAFPVPFLIESFRNDIMDVLLHYVRTVGRVTSCGNEEKNHLLWSLIGMQPSESIFKLYNPELNAIDLGMRYENIKESTLAQYMERLYEFAFYGRKDPSAEDMEYESTYMWVTDLVMDALQSHITEEWDSYGGIIKKPAAHCALVAETANARCILEYGKYFSYYSGGKDGNQLPEEGSLTIRQMALLSGMEEMSIRSAANPKRANRLKTYTSDKGGTRVTRDEAKEWLKLKGRYVPVTTYSSSAELNLVKQKFSRYLDLESALDTRAIVLASRIGEDEIKNKLEELGVRNHPKFSFENNFIAMNAENFTNETLIKKIAELLELPQDLLVLRCKQTAANEQLSVIERQLQDAVQSAKSIITE